MPPRPRSPRPRPTPSRRPRVAGMAPAAPRPDAAASAPGRGTGPAEPTDTTAAAPAPDRRPEPTADPAPQARPAEDRSAGQAKPKRPRPKPAPAAPRDAEPATASASTVELTTGSTTGPTVELTRPARGRSGAGEGDRTEQLSVVPGGRGKAAPTEIVEITDVAETPARGGRLTAVLHRQAVPLLAAALVVLATVAVVAGVQDAQLRGTPAATNTALVDVGTTADVAGQLSAAIETVYSFDFARLDENEKAARDVITPEFAADFDRLFGEVRARAPQQQAVVSATVTMSAVKEITGDHAVLVAFVDQQATRAAPDAQSQQLAAAGRLTVTGELVDGRWKIAAVTPL